MTPTLPKIIKGSPKRRGRGYGSGKGGHTTGRGQKGQKARGSVSILFQGTKVKKSLLKRLPLQRGRGRNRPLSHDPVIVNIDALNLLPPKTQVTTQTLIKHGIVKKNDAEKYGIKILGKGEPKQKFTIKVPISHSASEKILKSGGKIDIK